MSGSAIVLERETANDESASLVKIYFDSGVTVVEGDLVFDIENSKATQELRAPCSGILEHRLKVGDTVDFGVAIATVYSPQDWTSRVSQKPVEKHASPPISINDGQPAPLEKAKNSSLNTTDVVSKGVSNPRFSHAAAALIAQHSLNPSEFTTEFVVADDIKARLGTLAPAERQVSARISPISTTGTDEGRPVVGRKRAEIEMLSGGAGETMLSVLGVQLGAINIRRSALDFLDDRITDLVIYEAARLLSKFPNLNAHYYNGRVVQHQFVHAGLAIDGGGRLVVYGIENADKISLTELSDVIADAVARYANSELTTVELTRATFTVTDLSNSDLDFVFPLLQRGQSCILGITRSKSAGFRIYAGFDHRVTEGREVGLFLAELRERLFSFALPDDQSEDPSRCEYCDRSAAEVVRKGADKGLLKIADGRGREIFCCASCWNGW
jgi:pyruvate/2-oxoglutarate dehydrogenase complex dihydrolipoamide acyltransferase (E2) component